MNKILFIAVLLAFGCGTDSPSFKTTDVSLTDNVGARKNDKSAPTDSIGEPAQDAVKTSATTETVSVIVNGEEVLLPTDSVPTPAACTHTISGYNPEQVSCNVKVNRGSNIWWGVGQWATAQTAFTNKAASWISSLPAVAGNYCPYVPNTQTLIYVSHLVIAKAGKYSVEAIIDDTGTLALWKAGDPNQEVLSMAGGAFRAHKEVQLEPGIYSIVVAAVDVGLSATGMVASFRDSSNNIVKQSESDNSWCIFRAPSTNLNLKTFVPGVASCRSCFTGQ
jgi:hypothetical protein